MSSNTDYHAFLDSQILKEKAEMALIELKVFLAGPYIDVTKSKAHPDNSQNHSSAARFSLYQDIKKLGNMVILGEHKRLEAVADVKFPAQNNAAIFERNMIVKDDIHAVIILPSSPGSFLEFGDWANDPKIGKKLLVIIDQQYEEHINYLNLGPARLARDVGAEVVYIDYKDHTALLERTTEFLEKIVSARNREKIYGRA